MTERDISSTTATDYTGTIREETVSPVSLQAPSGKETRIGNQDFSKWFGYFMAVPEVYSAWIMKSIWTVGKGYEAEPAVSVVLDYITGNGKQTFRDVLFNAHLCMNINGRSYCEIVRHNEDIVNLKNLDPGRMTDIYDPRGRIKAFEYTQPSGKTKRFDPKDIFFLQSYALGMQGISRIRVMEETIKALNESFVQGKKSMLYQGRPFVLWKLKLDDTTKVAAWKVKLETAKNLGEDMVIPDDEDTVKHELVQINPSAFIIDWQNHLTNKFYRAVGMPLILFGQGGQTESGGKIEYLAHETVFENDQKYIEEQIWQQLYLRIDLTPPQSLMQNLQTDQAKDANQGMEIQKGDVTTPQPGATE